MLLGFAEAMDRKPINPDDVPPHAGPEENLRRVKRRKGRAGIGQLRESSRHHSRARIKCRATGVSMLRHGTQGDRRKRRAGRSSIIPGHFERMHHVRKKYACAACESNGDNPRMETAAKPETAIEKGLAGPGLLSYIVTSKFTDYLPLYRLEDIFARQGFEISRATQSVWCGDVGDLVEPLMELMANGCALRMWWPPTTPSCPC